MIDLSNLTTFEEIVKAVLFTGAGATIVGLGVRRKKSKDDADISGDQVKIHADGATRTLIDHLKEERDRLKADHSKIVDRLIVVETEKNKAVEMSAKFGAKVEHLTDQVRSLESLVEKLGSKLDSALDKLTAQHLKNGELSNELQQIRANTELQCELCASEQRIRTEKEVLKERRLVIDNKL